MQTAWNAKALFQWKIKKIRITELPQRVVNLNTVIWQQSNWRSLAEQVHVRNLIKSYKFVGSTPSGSATFFRGDWSWNIFYGHYLLSTDSRRTVVKRMCTILVNAGLGSSVGCAIRLETRPRVQPPLRSATFFPGDWSRNIFYGHSLLSADSRRAVVSFWWKNVHNTG